jgi:phage terminase small subunit
MRMRAGILTPRQQRFAEFYVGEAKHNGALAARLAGYAAASSHIAGSQLLAKPKIAAVVAGLEAAVAAEMGYTRARLIRDLLEAADMARLTSQPSALISAAVAIGIAAGLTQPEGRKGRKKVPPHGTEEHMASMSDADLAAIIDRGAAVLP